MMSLLKEKQTVKTLLKAVLCCLLMVVFVACSNDNQSTDNESATKDDEVERVAANDETEDLGVKDETNNTAVNDKETDAGENVGVDEVTETDGVDEQIDESLFDGYDLAEIELPSLLPSDLPFPADSEVRDFVDEEKEGIINVITSMPVDDLEELYNTYFTYSPLARYIIIKIDREVDFIAISYYFNKDDYSFKVEVTERDGEPITIHAEHIIH